MDFAKGAVVVWLASSIGMDDWGMLLSMLAVISGHIWPVQLRFCGGKGVATALGVIAMYDPVALLYMLALCVVSYPLVRNFTISGLLSFLLMPLAVFIWQMDDVQAVSLLVIAVVVVFAHRRDIAADLNK
ncbi:glycerol-3-phosphate acyltransferase, partial [Cohnella sp. REN36]|nr:glycerol-3-phosphate acyltransferase [Cohnella sp. REN36]